MLTQQNNLFLLSQMDIVVYLDMPLSTVLMFEYGHASREVQLKSPNWLFRQRKQEYSTPESADPVQHALPKRVEDVLEQEFSNLDWLSSYGLQAEEELYDKYIST